MNPSRLNPNKNILMLSISFSPIIGGIETHLEDLCRYLIRKNYRVWIVAYGPVTTKKDARIEKRRNLRIYRIPWFNPKLFEKLERYILLEFLYMIPPLLLCSFFFMLRYRKKITVIHSHGINASFVGIILAKIFRKHFVTTVHTVYNLKNKKLLGRIFAFLLNKSDKLLFVSHGIQKEFVDSGVESKKSSVFTYWANQERFRAIDKIEAKKILGWKGKFVVLFVGRLIKQKGANVLVKAASITNKNILYAFVTSGSYDDFVKMTQGRIPGNVIYIGPVKYSSLHLYYNAADMFVLPSQLREGFSRAVLEAASCGTPVIASNIGALPEVVNPRIGRLISPPTSKNFANVIEYYYNNQRKLNELAESCLKYAKKHFTETNAIVIEKSYCDEDVALY